MEKNSLITFLLYPTQKKRMRRMKWVNVASFFLNG